MFPEISPVLGHGGFSLRRSNPRAADRHFDGWFEGTPFSRFGNESDPIRK